MIILVITAHFHQHAKISGEGGFQSDGNEVCAVMFITINRTLYFRGIATSWVHASSLTAVRLAHSSAAARPFTAYARFADVRERAARDSRDREDGIGRASFWSPWEFLLQRRLFKQWSKPGRQAWFLRSWLDLRPSSSDSSSPCPNLGAMPKGGDKGTGVGRARRPLMLHSFY